MRLRVILLASGLSARFGENKLLYPVNGIKMYRRALGWALAFQELFPGRSGLPVQVVLVTAYEEIAGDAEEHLGFLRAAESLRDRESAPRLLVWNRDPGAGISRSIALGLTAAGGSREDIFLFSVCDQPYLEAGELMDFAEAFLGCKRGIGCLCSGGQAGNPVLFRGTYERELLSLSGDRGGKAVARAHWEDVLLYETKDPARLMDMDVKEELKFDR